MPHPHTQPLALGGQVDSRGVRSLPTSVHSRQGSPVYQEMRSGQLCTYRSQGGKDHRRVGKRTQRSGEWLPWRELGRLGARESRKQSKCNYPHLLSTYYVPELVISVSASVAGAYGYSRTSLLHSPPPCPPPSLPPLCLPPYQSQALGWGTGMCSGLPPSQDRCRAGTPPS